MTTWFAIYTQSNAESKVEYHLKRQGFEVYLPRTLKKRSHARRVDWVLSPMFPRYLFVGVNIETTSWRSIKSTIGVNRVICFGEQPLAVPEYIIESLKFLEDDDGIISIGANSNFQRGDRIEIREGALSELKGTLQEFDEQGRVTLLLELMGCETKVKTSLANIAAA